MPKQRTFWQITGGPLDRSYVETFFRYGVGLIGPGDAGAWNAEREDCDFDGGSVRHFASEVAISDIFLLRMGTSRICGIGVVASDYLYLPQFDDVNGWPLQHARRVRWYRLPVEHDFSAPVFGSMPRRIGRIANEEVAAYADRFLNSAPTDWQTAALPTLPPEEEPLDEIPTALRDVVAIAHDLGCHLYLDRERFGESPSEEEIISHLVVPLLVSLGWPPERIAVEWRCIDVALFKNLPRTPENLWLIIEAKRLGAGVEGALEQAKGYAETLQVARDVVVTDGLRYRLYSQAVDYAPVAYANLARLKKSATNLFDRLRRP